MHSVNSGLVGLQGRPTDLPGALVEPKGRPTHSPGALGTHVRLSDERPGSSMRGRALQSEAQPLYSEARLLNQRPGPPIGGPALSSEAELSTERASGPASRARPGGDPLGARNGPKVHFFANNASKSWRKPITSKPLIQLLPGARHFGPEVRKVWFLLNFNKKCGIPRF